MDRLEHLQERLETFYAERDWRRFQTPKDLAASTAVEVAELQELFLWQADDAAVVERCRAEVASELADIFINLLNLARLADVDLLDACGSKLDELELRYPVNTVKSRVVVKGARR
jgi:NTP pyrophosphatase (non-canonical NTP hydrolase)